MLCNWAKAKLYGKVRLLAKQDKYDFVNFTSRIFQQEVGIILHDNNNNEREFNLDFSPA